MTYQEVNQHVSALDKDHQSVKRDYELLSLYVRRGVLNDCETKNARVAVLQAALTLRKLRTDRRAALSEYFERVLNAKRVLR